MAGRSWWDSKKGSAPSNSAAIRKPPKRRSCHKSPISDACHANGLDHQFTDDEMEFIKAIEDFKSKSGRRFPMWTEVLWVVKSLGYEKKCQIGTTCGGQSDAIGA